MTSGRYGLVLREVGRLLGGGTVASVGAGQLLERFAADRDGAAFEALVTRHGPMVLGTCRRMLADPLDVEDAFQATFLVLARKAGSIRDADRLGPWLHGVARRVAARSRALSGRRKSFERPAVEEPAVESPDLVERAEVRGVLDEELSRLPEKYRAPLVLCYLEGLTHDEAAETLRWPVGTVRSRLAGGRDRLRTRLARRGLSPSVAVPALLPSGALPTTLLATTVRVATSAGSPSAHVLNLAKGALIAMTWNKLKMIAAVGLTAGLTVGGAGVAAQQGGNGKAESPGVEKVPTTLEQVEGEMLLLQVEASTIEKKVKELQAEHGRALRPLMKAFEDVNSRSSELAERRKELKSNAVSTAGDDRIKQLEAALKASRSETQEVLKKLDVLATQVARGAFPRDSSTGPEAPAEEETRPPKRDGAVGEGPTPKPSAKAAADPSRRSASPMVVSLGDPLVMVIPGEQDRVTVLNTETGTRATHRFAGRVTEVAPIVSPGRVSLRFRGPEVRQVIAYDPQDGKWYPQDLAEPTTEANPVLGGGEVMYQIGRFVYVFSFQAKKWGVLEMKRDPGRQSFLLGMNGIRSGKMIVPEGDLIHFYDPKTGEWTHIDTKDEK